MGSGGHSAFHRKSKRIDSRSLWQKQLIVGMAERDPHLTYKYFNNVGGMPIESWRPFFLFFGARDSNLHEVTGGSFPARMIPDKTHPVFSIKPIRDVNSFVVCPCSSQPQYRTPYCYIKKDTVLLHTEYRLDRNSYIVKHLRFNVPLTMVNHLVFKGEVPEEAVVKVTKEQRHDR